MTHDDAYELLPWLVNDSLPAGEKTALLDHAQACVVCRRELAELETLQAGIGSHDDATEPPPADMRRINARIDRYMARRRWLPDVLDAVAARLPSPLRLAVAAQAIVIVALLGLLLVREPVQPSYTTLSDEPALPPGEYLRIVVSESLDDQGFNALLERHGLEVVAGPSERGVATVAFGDGIAPDRQQQIAAALSENPALRFVQPVSVRVTP